MLDESVQPVCITMDESEAPEVPEAPHVHTTHPPTPTSSWTYPTRFCRICREDVPATVTLYPPGLPPAFQTPVVEYKNDDEYGRLIKPCQCRGGMRYIHELCLLRSRTEGVRPGSMWKCHECGHQFNFQRLTIQRFLSGKFASGFLTIFVMITIMFILGFIADPIINLYVDPYDVLIGNEHYWQEVEVNQLGGRLPAWSLHFLKGLVSMGLVGFLKTMLFNPWHWWNFRNSGLISGRTGRTSTTGRDRAVNISWIAVLIGVTSAFYFFYRWVQAIIGRTLTRIGNNIVDTQLPDDDEDIKPPPGLGADNSPPAKHSPATEAGRFGAFRPGANVANGHMNAAGSDHRGVEVTEDTEIEHEGAAKESTWETVNLPKETTASTSTGVEDLDPAILTNRNPSRGDNIDGARHEAIDLARSPGWSFANL